LILRKRKSRSIGEKEPRNTNLRARGNSVRGKMREGGVQINPEEELLTILQRGRIKGKNTIDGVWE